MKSNTRPKVLTRMTFTVRLHQQLKIHPGQRLVHKFDMFYMAEGILNWLYRIVETRPRRPSSAFNLNNTD